MTVGSWTPDLRGDEEGSLTVAVGQALGAASMCWSDVTAAGVFDSVRASEIVEGLVAWLRGPVEAALDNDLQQLTKADVPFNATLAATARALARSLDNDPDRRASTAKELRATLDKLAEGASADDGGPDLSGLSDPGRP